MYFPDLSNECQVDGGPHVRAVGWLAKAHSYPTGDMPADFVATLLVLIRTAVQPVVAGGPHFCEMCAPATKAGGVRNVWVPAKDCLSVAPEMIVHYIEAHKYRPPDEFITAVMACPKQGSDEFLARLIRFSKWGKSAKEKNP